VDPRTTLIGLAYLVAAVLFILGLKGLTHPRTAVRGNLLGASGMLLAVVVTLLAREIVGFWLIGAGLVIGAAVGGVLAVKIQMTAMPQLVALFNGFGGGASVLVAGAELVVLAGKAANQDTPIPGSGSLVISAMLAGLIGAVTFWGSLVAFAKLQEFQAFKKPFDYPFQKEINVALAVLALLLVVLGIATQSVFVYVLVILVAAVLGVTLVNPIGGADMPVVIALLNSYSGLAAAATGFVLNNTVLIIAGSLVGASGVILTQIMCRAMNRSL
jgi:NAD(P) transhydrogenase subunit beta